jgi:hypothetical protein
MGYRAWGMGIENAQLILCKCIVSTLVILIIYRFQASQRENSFLTKGVNRVRL